MVSRHSCVADRLSVVVRFPAGPRVRLKTVDPPKGNGLGQKKGTVKFGEETFHTMDEYDNELQLDDHNNVDAWMEDEKEDFATADVPPELWSDFPIDRCPPTPDEYIDRIADRVELSRLCGMKVLVGGNVDGIDARSNTLTSRFVYDWRLKERLMPDGTTAKCWLRRSRLVAREHSF